MKFLAVLGLVFATASSRLLTMTGLSGNANEHGLDHQNTGGYSSGDAHGRVGNVN